MKGLVLGTALLLLMPLPSGPCLCCHHFDCVLFQAACRHPVAADNIILGREKGSAEWVQRRGCNGVQHRE